MALLITAYDPASKEPPKLNFSVGALRELKQGGIDFDGEDGFAKGDLLANYASIAEAGIRWAYRPHPPADVVEELAGYLTMTDVLAALKGALNAGATEGSD